MKLEVHVTTTRTLQPGEKVTIITGETSDGAIILRGKRELKVSEPKYTFTERSGRHGKETELTINGWMASSIHWKKPVTVVLR